MRYVIYARKSTDDKRRQIESIPDQLKVLTAIAEEKDLDIVETFTESISAKNTGRPEFNRMITGFNKKQFDAILTWDLDRLSRNMIDGGVLMHMIQEGGIKKIYTPSEQHDCHSNMVYLAVKFGVATDQIIRLRKDILRGLKSRVAQGYWHTLPPLGYKTLGKGVLKPDDNFPYVQKAYKLYDSGNFSVATLSEYLFEKGLRSRYGKKVGASSVHNALTNSAYKGEIHVQWKGDDEISIQQAQHLPAVSEDLWERVQQRLDKKNQNYHPSGVAKPYLFQKKLRCACGSLMSCYQTKGNNYLECKNRDCELRFNINGKARRTIREDYLQLVSGLLFAQMEATGKMLKEAKNLVAASLSQQKEDRKNIKARIKKQITALENKIDILTDKLLSDIVDEKTYKRKKKQLEDEIKAKKRLLENPTEDDKVLGMYQKLHQISEKLKMAFSSGDEETQREILELLVSTIKPFTDKIEIEFTELGGLLFYGYGYENEKQIFELKNSAVSEEKGGLLPLFIQSGQGDWTNFELFTAIQNQSWQVERLFKLVCR